MPQSTLTKNCPFLGNTFEPYFPLNWNDTSNLEPRANPFNDQKYKSQNRDTLKSPWLMPWGTLIENDLFLENPSSHNPLLLTKMVSTSLWTITLFLTNTNKTLLSHTLSFWQMTWTTFWAKRRTLSKWSLYEKRCFKLEDHPRQATLPRVDHSKREEKMNE